MSDAQHEAAREKWYRMTRRLTNNPAEAELWGFDAGWVAAFRSLGAETPEAVAALRACCATRASDRGTA